jgi:hypothetical protein
MLLLSTCSWHRFSQPRFSQPRVFHVAVRASRPQAALYPRRSPLPTLCFRPFFSLRLSLHLTLLSWPIPIVEPSWPITVSALSCLPIFSPHPLIPKVLCLIRLAPYILAYPHRTPPLPSLSLSCFVHHLCLHAQSSRSFPFMSPRSAGALPSPPLAQLLSPVSPLPPGSAGVPVLNVDAVGQPLTFRAALAGPFRQQWLASDDDELVKLVRGTRTLTPVHTYTSTPTYYNRVVKEKWTQSFLLLPGSSRSLASDVSRRVRGTAGGDRLPYSCPPCTVVASLSAVNICLNSVVSDHAFFGTVDLTDFYLGTPVLLPLSARQFIRIDVGSYSPAVLSQLSLLPFIKTAASGKPFVIFRIDQTMYGLKDAGKLSNPPALSPLSVWFS